jgi:hypothetical protein
MTKRLIATVMLAAALTLSAAPASFAGAIGGPRSTSDRIAARGERSWRVTFAGGQTARVAVAGDGYTVLDLYVYNLYGNLIAWDERMQKTCVVEWRPKYDETFVVIVVNRGSTYNDFGLATN